jgi:hypothetical protein
MIREHPFLGCVLLLGAALALHACGPGPNSNPTESTAARAPAEQAAKPESEQSAAVSTRPGEPTSTSEVPPPIKPFSGLATPVRDYPRVAGNGRCAPLYKNGTRGNCIADKPCRGYGIRNDENQVLCMCYLTHGGCDAKSRCDDRAHACVADTTQKNSDE